VVRRRVPLGTDEKLFRAMHRRMLDGPRPVPPWARLDPAGVPDALRERVRRGWAARVEAEYRSMVVFGELIARFPEAGLPLEVSCAASRLLQDEARHTELCARVAEAFGGYDEATLDPGHLRLVDDALPAHLFVARWTASMFCVGEAASVGLLGVLRDGATDPCVASVLDTLLRDEVLHDRFGWALARVVFPRLTDDEREWLGADLAFAFAHYDQMNAGCLRPDGGEVPAAPETPEDPGAVALGIASRWRFAPAFYRRIDEVILPSFAALGVPAYEAWALRHEAAATAAREA
jgi:hypothetical protein